MADGFGYVGFSGKPYPFWLSPRYLHPPAFPPPFLATHPVESSSYDQAQAGFDPMIPHGSYDYNFPPLTTPSSFYTQPDNFSLRSEDFPPLTPPSSSFYAQPGNFGEDSCKHMGGYYYPSSSDAVYYPPMARQRLVWAPYSSATVSSLADMLIRSSQEPFFVPVPPSGVCASSHAFDLNRPGHYYSGYAPPPVQPYLPVPSMPMPSFNTEASSDGSTGSRSPWSSQPLNAQSSGSLFTEKGEASGVSSLYQKPNTLVAGSENGSSLKNAIGDLNCDEEHESCNYFRARPSAPTMFSTGSESLGAVKGNASQSGVNYTTPPGGSANQPSEDVQGSQKTFKLQEQLVDSMNRVKKTMLSTDLSVKGSSLSNAETGQSPVCDRGNSPSPACSPRVSSVVNAMHILSQVLVNECINNGSFLKPEQFEKLDKIVEKLAKCLKKITCNKTKAGDASDSTQAMHVSCPNVVDLNEAPIVVAKDSQGGNVQPLDSFGFKESVDKSKMTQSIKNILSSNFHDGEENHPKTFLYKNLWLETEAALCSSTCLTRYHRIQNETGNLKLQDKGFEISADASTLKQQLFLNPEESKSILNVVEQETTESLIKDGGNCRNNVVTVSHDAPQSSRFNSGPVEAVISLMSRSFTHSSEQEDHVNFKPDAPTPDTVQQESLASTTEEKYINVIDRFQILKHQEMNRKLKSEDFSETRINEQEESSDASEMATIGRSSHMSDVMGSFQMLKRREVEQVQKSLNSVDFDSDSGSDFDSDSCSYFDSESENDQPRNKTQMCDYLCAGSMMATGGNSKIETCANTEPSADGEGYESPTSDWEHVLKDD
ncbi:unnamed protein product [Eruca vesicaria subsp. sativa]|uniref:Uncharacterized protein n=1 Tax=Eruca vesicaria subsp. sativa TaxID=29727 RepID=A0ABC8JYD1_ERUVS|nr:unnamed protein product [Eruca vesicaria subsp. sativa]